jgi:hypothetical protein
MFVVFFFMMDDYSFLSLYTLLLLDPYDSAVSSRCTLLPLLSLPSYRFICLW